MAYHPRSTWKRIYREEEARRRAEKRRFTYFYRVAWAVIGFVTMGVAMWLWKEIR